MNPLHDTSKYPSEAAKYLPLTAKYLGGNGLDLGSGGWPVIPNAIQVELPPDEFARYTGGREPAVPIGWHGDIFDLPFRDNTCDYVHCSHVIEDFDPMRWPVMFTEWMRVLKPGGFLVLLVPEVVRWNEAIRRGQPPNCAHHAPEPSLGDISRVAGMLNFHVVEERLTDLYPGDYSILAVLQK